MIRKIFLTGIVFFGITTLNATDVVVEALKTIEGTSHQSPNYIRTLKRAQKIFKKKLQKRCGYNAAYFAQLHTQDEWEEFQTKKEFKEEFGRLCPNGKKYLKEKWIKPLYLWSKEYAKDSLYRPLC